MSKRGLSKWVVGLPDRYSDLELIATGGSGRVFRAHDTSRNLSLALKVVGNAGSAWLLREFDTLRQIRHESLVQVYDWASLPGGDAYYTMELLDGGDWGRRMGAPQDPESVRSILVNVLRGLAHLHAHGEIHGDLKPGNVLLGHGGVVKLADVGMGTVREPGEVVSGTPGYAAPELWEGSPVAPRADLYSVGVMAYEALTGRHPFAGRTVREVISGQIAGWVASPGAYGVSVPADLERAVMRALDRNPGLRPGSADEFMEGFGVEDRIGEILGGKLCARETELKHAESLLLSAMPETPRLVALTGPSQIGKTAFLAELSHRLIANGVTSVFLEKSPIETPEAGLARIAQRLGMEKPATGHPSVSAIGEYLYTQSAMNPTFIWADPAEDGAASATDAFVSLARFVWASSVESGERRPVLLAIAITSSPAHEGKFMEEITLRPLTVEGVSQLADGMLGRAQLQPEFIKKVHSLTGGVPGAVGAVFEDLIQRRILDRRSGCWVFREMQELQTIEMPEGGSRWSVAWAHLSPNEKEAIRALALLGSGLPERNVPRLREASQLTDTLRGLNLKGWVAVSGGCWTPISEEVRRTALVKSTSNELRATGLALLGSCQNGIEREDRADLSLAYSPSLEALSEGLWAAGRSTERGSLRQAVRRLAACIELARAIGDRSAECAASLAMARAFNQLGLPDEARSQLLDARTWPTGGPQDVPWAERESLLGVCERCLGNVEEAAHYQNSAVELAERLGAKALVARAQAELAEIEWRHGDDVARARAIATIKAALRSAIEGDSAADEVAALTYQLGAALIISGQREPASDVLREGMMLDCSAYWKMRLTNAYSSAAYYLGRFDEALSLTDAAWRIAEQIGADHLKPRILFNRAGVLYALGRIQEVLSDDLLAAQWALRTGSADDLATARNGAAIALILLGRYEEAIEQARRGEVAAVQLRDRGAQATSLGLQAQSFFQIGDLAQSEELTRAGLELVGSSSLARSTPRLLWFLGKALAGRGDAGNAERVLLEAEGQLLKSKDWEDLPGVQIELNLLSARQGKGGQALRNLKAIFERARSESALIVQLYAAVAIGEVVVDLRVDNAEVAEILLEALERAERSGIVDTIWRINFYLGVIEAESGDMHGAQARFRQSLSAIRGIADRLSREHRRVYLDSPHVATALSQISPRLKHA